MTTGYSFKLCSAVVDQLGQVMRTAELIWIKREAFQTVFLTNVSPLA
jgi:hypothetical protein